MLRVALQSEEINYIQVINELIDSSKKDGFAYKLVETGVLYFVAHQDPSEKEDSKKMFEEAGLRKPTAFFLNAMKFNELGYYPFSLNFTDPENYFDFLQGNFVINIFIDFDVISQIAKKYGFSFHKSDEPDFPYQFKSMNDEADLPYFRMSYHFFGRVIVEFVSLDWLLTNAFERFNNKFFEDAHNSNFASARDDST